MNSRSHRTSTAMAMRQEPQSGSSRTDSEPPLKTGDGYRALSLITRCNDTTSTRLVGGICKSGTKVSRCLLVVLSACPFWSRSYAFSLQVLFTIAYCSLLNQERVSLLYWVGVLPYSMTSRGRAGLSRFQAMKARGGLYLVFIGHVCRAS